MKQTKSFKQQKSAAVWSRFSRRSYAVFRSIGREVSIGVLTVASLSFACPDSASARVAMSYGSASSIEEAATTANDDEVDLDQLQVGDLLFCIAAADSKDNVARAITDVTTGINSERIYHVAIFANDPDGQPTVIEATGKGGVREVPLSVFLEKTESSANGRSSVLVGRLTLEGIAEDGARRARQYLGRPYDYLYLEGDSAIYCSELVHYCYLDGDGRPLFPQQPMSFHDSTGRVTDFWTEYYRKRGAEVPEGQPGSNPGDMSRSATIRILGFLSTSSDRPKTRAKTLDAVEIVASASRYGNIDRVRQVTTIDRRQIERSAAPTVNDLLKLSTGVEVRQRGAMGVQTDVGLFGGTEDQLTLLLNGINLTNPQTGHLTFDLPVTTDDVQRIDIVGGGAGRLFGSSAFSGAINIVSLCEQNNYVSANLSGGSYGFVGGTAALNLSGKGFSSRLNGGYSRSDGAASNDDFSRFNGFWIGRYTGRRFRLTAQAGISSIDYGANTFYGTGSSSQWEQNKRYLASVQGQYAGPVEVSAQAYWTRSLDHYVWVRINPEAYQNFHQNNVFGGEINASRNWKFGRTTVGAELHRENILSTNLGKTLPESKLHKYKIPGHDGYYNYKDGRTLLNFYVQQDVTIGRFSASAGLLGNHASTLGGGLGLYPGVDVSWNPAGGWRLYASFNRSMRMPTWTDLYYNGPGLEGNRELKPEKSTDWHLGGSFTGRWLTASIRGFYRRGTDMIDWVKRQGAEVFSSANSDIRTLGVQTSITLDFTDLYGPRSFVRDLSVSYGYTDKKRTDLEQSATYQSDIIYLRHKLAMQLNHRIFSRLTAQWQLTVKNRRGWFDNVETGRQQEFGTYATLDLRLQWTDRLFTAYVQANNLTNHRYYDYANIPQPGIWALAGLRLKFEF